MAAAAGFNTCVVAADFTVSGNFWSNTANYVTNCGASASVAGTPSSWHFTSWTSTGGGTGSMLPPATERPS